MKLSVDRLRVLVVVQRTGSLAAAARELGVGPSAVSQQLSNFEREVGDELLIRSTKPATLTPLGVTLARHGEAILEELERAVVAAEQARHNVAGTYVIAALPTIAVTVLTTALRLLQETAPALDIRLRDLEAGRSVDALVAQRIDMAIVDTYAGLPTAFPDRTDVVTLGQEPVQLFAPKARVDGLGPGPLELDRLAGCPWVLAPPVASCGAAALQLCHAAGFVPDIKLETNDLLLLRTFVADGFGVTLLPRLALLDPPPTGVVLDIAAPNAQRTIHALTRTATQGRPSDQLVLDALRTAANHQLDRTGDQP